MTVEAGGELLLVVGSDGRTLIVGAPDGGLVAETTVPSGLLGGCLHPDGEVACLFGPLGARLWVPKADRVLHLVDEQWCSSACWSPAGRLALAAGNAVVVHDEQGRVLARSDALDSTTSHVVWIDSERLAVTTRDGINLFAGDLSTHTVIPLATPATALTTSPNRAWIAAGTHDGTVQLRATTDRSALEMRGYPFKVSQVQFSACGRYLANDGAPEISLWDFSEPGPRARVAVRCDPPDGVPRCSAFAWHPREPTLCIAWHGGVVELLDATRGRPGHLLRGRSQVVEVGIEVSSLAFGRSGGVLVIGAREGRLMAMELERGATHCDATGGRD